MNPRGMKVAQNAYFSLLTHTKQLLLVTFCYQTAEIVKWDKTEWMNTDGLHKTDMKVEIIR